MNTSNQISKRLHIIYRVSDKPIPSKHDWFGVWDDYLFAETRKGNSGSDSDFKEYFESLRDEEYLAGELYNKTADINGVLRMTAKDRTSKIKVTRIGFTIDEMHNVLSKAEMKLIYALINEMNIHNCVYLNHEKRSEARIKVIDRIANSLAISTGSVKQSISRIIKKQLTCNNWFIKRTSSIDGEIRVSHNLAISHLDMDYDMSVISMKD